METKSRYEVIADLEDKKRGLIKERDSLNDVLKNKEKQIKLKERQKSDTILLIDRELTDLNEDLDNFKSTIDVKKETLQELIKSVDESLDRFNKMNKEK